MAEKWLTIDQIADYLQVSKEKIYKLCQRGRMPASKLGGQWRFKLKMVDRWAESLSNQSHKNQKKKSEGMIHASSYEERT